MLGSNALYSVAALIAASATSMVASAADLPAIKVEGNKFFYASNGSQFYIRGVAYQRDTSNETSGSTINDPLADYEACSRDIPYLQQLDTNVIRVYAVNATQNHTKCMKALNDAGIYVLADLSAPDDSINRQDPSWTVELYDRYKEVIDMFANYTNVLGFFAGNEVTNNNTNTDASAFVKAALRDSKKYIKEKGYRAIPVGYSSNDDEKTRVPLADYFSCGDEDAKADFFGINMYEWCGDSNFNESGYAQRTKDFSNLTIPIFFSEYGCNRVTPRKFTEVQALFGKNMTDVWSGGIVYMYFQETNKYGLVSVNGSKVSTLTDFNNYKSEILAISPTSARNASYTSRAHNLSCPTNNKNWSAATALPPTPNNDICECMDAANSCVVSSDVKPKEYAALFDYICQQVSCDGINANGTSGKYGSYSFCSPKEKLNFVMNLYYHSKGGSKSDCDFSGSASIQSASTRTGCSAALSQIGTMGTKTASSNATYTISSTTSASNSTSITSSKKSSSSKKSTSAKRKDVSVTSESTTTKTESSSKEKTSKSKGAAAQNDMGFIQTVLTSFGTISFVAGLGFAIL